MGFCGCRSRVLWVLWVLWVRKPTWVLMMGTGPKSIRVLGCDSAKVHATLETGLGCVKASGDSEVVELRLSGKNMKANEPG